MFSSKGYDFCGISTGFQLNRVSMKNKIRLLDLLKVLKGLCMGFAVDFGWRPLSVRSCYHVQESCSCWACSISI